MGNDAIFFYTNFLHFFYHDEQPSKYSCFKYEYYKSHLLIVEETHWDLYNCCKLIPSDI